MTQTIERAPLGAPAGLNAGYLLTQPTTFEDCAVVDSFYEQPHHGFGHGHLVVFYIHPEIGGAPGVIDPAAPVFGIGHVEYDDVEGEAITHRLDEYVSYAHAIRYLADAMRRSVS